MLCFCSGERPCGTSEPNNPGQPLETPSGYTGQVGGPVGWGALCLKDIIMSMRPLVCCSKGIYIDLISTGTQSYPGKIYKKTTPYISMKTV